MNAWTTFALAVAFWGASTLSYAAPVTLRIDSGATVPEMKAEQFGLLLWRGIASRSQGTVVLDRATGNGLVQIEIDMASIDFGIHSMNEFGRGPQLFDVDRFPASRFVGQFERGQGGSAATVTGELTLRGVSRPLVLTMESLECVPLANDKGERCTAEIEGRFSRDEFGLDAGRPLGMTMEVQLRIRVVAATGH